MSQPIVLPTGNGGGWVSVTSNSLMNNVHTYYLPPDEEISIAVGGSEAPLSEYVPRDERNAKRVAEGRCVQCGTLRIMRATGLDDCKVCE